MRLMPHKGARTLTFGESSLVAAEGSMRSTRTVIPSSGYKPSGLIHQKAPGGTRGGPQRELVSWLVLRDDSTVPGQATASTLRLSSEILLPADEVAG